MRARFHLSGNARTGDIGCSRHIPSADSDRTEYVLPGADEQRLQGGRAGRGHRERQDALLALEFVAATPKNWSDRASEGVHQASRSRQPRSSTASMMRSKLYDQALAGMPMLAQMMGIVIWISTARR